MYLLSKFDLLICLFVFKVVYYFGCDDNDDDVFFKMNIFYRGKYFLKMKVWKFGF